MTSPGQQTSGNAASSDNGQSSLHDLFAMTDEQILEIEPEASDVQVRDAADQVFSTQAGSLDQATNGTERNDSGSRVEPLPQNSQHNARPSQVRGDEAVDPPQWLAERMADLQAGAEARELWNGVQQSRQEAAAFREVFAKPEDARAAAQRSRLLDDIDRAYFTGDSSQRAQLAASMLREDPAAFREMVFAGLRALEETGTSGATNNFAQRSPNTIGAGLVYTEPRSAPPADARAADRLGGASATPTNADADVAAHYASFERAANEELERTVGSAIERTLDQALPHGHRAENAAMRGRLAATVRQDIEKALQGDRQLGEQVAQVLSARRLDSNARAQIVRLIGDRAQQLVPGTAKRVLGEWTQTTLDSHRGRTNRIETAAARRDVATASSESRTVSSVSNSPRSAQNQNQNRQRENRSSAQASASHGRKVDYRRVSDEQILDS
jgi:hypothetical protein